MDAFTAGVPVIFPVADYGLQADLDQALPELTASSPSSGARRFIGVRREPAIYQTLSPKPKH